MIKVKEKPCCFHPGCLHLRDCLLTWRLKNIPSRKDGRPTWTAGIRIISGGYGVYHFQIASLYWNSVFDGCYAYIFLRRKKNSKTILPKSKNVALNPSQKFLAIHSLEEGGSTQKCKSIQGSEKLPGIIDFWRWISKTSLCKRWGMGVWHCFVPNIPKLQSRLHLLLMAEILLTSWGWYSLSQNLQGFLHPNRWLALGISAINSTSRVQQRASCHYQGATLCQRKSKGDEELWNLQYLRRNF